MNDILYRAWDNAHGKENLKMVRSDEKSFPNVGFFFQWVYQHDSKMPIMRSTGKLDANDHYMFADDIVVLNNEGEHTKEEYWSPIYLINDTIYSFDLIPIGGGKAGDSYPFQMKYYPSTFEVIGNIYSLPDILYLTEGIKNYIHEITKVGETK